LEPMIVSKTHGDLLVVGQDVVSIRVEVRNKQIDIAN
jgi:hypothetical protein